MRLFRPCFIAGWIFPEAMFRIGTDEKIISLTFDDGPDPASTPVLLDLLGRHNIKALFFCNGRNAENHPSLMQRILSEGHIAGNHTWSHLNGWTSSVKNYLDDVLAHASTWEQHLQTVRDFLTRVRKANLTLRPSKCSLGYISISFLGHTVGAQTIRPHSKIAQKITDAPTPTTKKQLRSFLGLAGYYRRFVPDFAAIAVPLSDLTKKGAANELQWGTSQDRSFTALKAYIASSPILRLPDLKEVFILQTDASNVGIGAVLLQEVSGVKHPICFASRKLLSRERHYSTIERECLAIVWGIQKFERYLYGKPFILETDHQPLQYVGKAQFKNGRLMRWALALQPYSFTIRAIKGSENMGADFLSRCI